MKSAYLSNRALRSLNRFGDIIIPRNGQFPSFSEYGGLEHIDKLIGYAPQDDIADLNTLMTILSFMPTLVFRIIIKMCTNAAEKNGPLSSLLRQLNLAIRGLIFSCYYSERPGRNYNGVHPTELINSSINRVID